MKAVNEMHVAVITYFSAEKRESLLFLLVGVAAIAASVLLWRTGSPWRGMAWPLSAIALIQIVVGSTVYSGRTNKSGTSTSSSRAIRRPTPPPSFRG